MYDQVKYLDNDHFPPSELVMRPSVLPFIADHHLPYLVPAIVFWVISLVFHYIDTHRLLAKYKLHTPAEDLRKNRATRQDVIKFALLQQAAQCALGYWMADDQELHIPDDYMVASWAKRIRFFQSLSYQWLNTVSMQLFSIEIYPKGYDSLTTAAFSPRTFAPPAPNVSHILDTRIGQVSAPLSALEMVTAKTAYWVLVPVLQYIAAMFLADSMQYFTHRAFHVNKWLYKHVHSMHHDIYVPFAYGAFYNHPLETIPIDGILFPLCLTIARLDNRQSAFFGAIWTFKTVVDHCGYDFPYNPCNIVCPNSVLYHDLHHQTWGMKYNFSVYGSVWDWLMGTHWSPRDGKAQEKYNRSKVTAESSVTKKKDEKSFDPTIGDSTAIEL